MAKRNYFVHASAIVEKGAKVGQGTKIWCFSHILSDAKIGQNCNLGQNVVIHSTAIIGNHVKIQNNVSVYDAVILEDDVFCGPSCVFTNIINPRSAVPRNSDEFYEKTLVRKGATIGANATIICGIEIGQYAFIGAGAVVTKNIPDYALFYGNPARLHGWVCQCGQKLEFIKDLSSCSACQKKYTQKNNKVQKIS